MSVGLVTGLLFAAISINMSVECSNKTAKVATPISAKGMMAQMNLFWKMMFISMNFNKGIYKGTKFCGDEYVSKYDNATDFGTSEQTDRCCKEQGKCKIYIRPETSKSGIENKSNYTIWGCNCTEKFKACLDAVATSESASDADKMTALEFGWFFFNFISLQCMKGEETQRFCVIRSWKGDGCDLYGNTIAWKLVKGPTFNLQ